MKKLKISVTISGKDVDSFLRAQRLERSWKEDQNERGARSRIARLLIRLGAQTALERGKLIIIPK